MKAVIQRVLSASVSVEGRQVSAIGEGLFVLLGVAEGDDEDSARRLAEKIPKLRIFEDESGRLGEPLGGREILCVSQFTLLGDVSRGNRPGFEAAASPEVALPLYDLTCELMGAAKGAFGAEMTIESVCHGPVTILLEE